MGAHGLWAEVLFSKYMQRNEDNLLSARQGDSALWKFIVRQKDFVERGSRWNIRDGKEVSFFNDKWLLPHCALKEVCLKPLSSTDERSTVADWVAHGSWDFSRLQGLLPINLIKKLITVLPPMSEAGGDILVWNGTKNGIFTVKSAYSMIMKTPASPRSGIFNKIWKWQGAERVRVFMWLAVQHRLPTNVWRSTWGGCSPICGYCDAEREDVLHILRDCSYAKNLWRYLLNPTFSNQFFAAPLCDWFTMNLERELGRISDIKWQHLWAVAIWKLWIWRNNMIFQ